MKNLNLIFAFVLGMFFANDANAQAKTDYFPGKWAVTIIGTPQGDSKMNFVFERKEGKLIGSVQDSTGKVVSTITQINETDKTINASFTVDSYDVTLSLEPVDADHIKGNVMDMFEAKGVRIKENEPLKR